MKFNKKEFAQMLYCEQHKTQKEIADMLGVSQQQISNWVVKGKWNDLRTGISVSRKTQIAHLFAQMDSINTNIAERPGNPIATPDEAQTLFTLSKAIQNIEKEIGISEIVSTGMQFCDWIREKDLERAKDVCQLWDEFLTSRLN